MGLSTEDLDSDIGDVLFIFDGGNRLAIDERTTAREFCIETNPLTIPTNNHFGLFDERLSLWIHASDIVDLQNGVF